MGPCLAHISEEVLDPLANDTICDIVDRLTDLGRHNRPRSSGRRNGAQTYNVVATSNGERHPNTFEVWRGRLEGNIRRRVVAIDVPIGPENEFMGPSVHIP